MQWVDRRTGQIKWYSCLLMGAVVYVLVVLLIHYVFPHALREGADPEVLRQEKTVRDKMEIVLAMPIAVVMLMWWLSDWARACEYRKAKPIMTGLGEYDARALAATLADEYPDMADEVRFCESDGPGEWMVYSYGFFTQVNRMKTFAKGWVAKS